MIEGGRESELDRGGARGGRVEGPGLLCREAETRVGVGVGKKNFEETSVQCYSMLKGRA